MNGKATLLVVAGFSLIFLVVGRNLGNISSRAVDNSVEYYNQTVAHELAVSSANLAANQIFFDNAWNTGFSNLDLKGGKINATVQTIDVIKNIKKITSAGTYQGKTHTVEVVLAPSSFSKFAYYSTNEGGTIWWTGNDTVWGPFHTQDHLRVSNHPVFYGKTTTNKSLVYYKNKNTDHPKFYGGFEQGIGLPLPTNGLSPIEAVADDDGYKFTGKDTVYLTFAGDSIKFRYQWNKPDTTVLTASLAPNGVIFAKDAVVRLKGTVKGQYTVAVSGSSSNKGKVFLDNDIVYSQDPRVYPNSTDLLGIVAKNEILITENTANNNHINIHASIYSESKGFGAQNYNSRPVSGDINLLGGIIQNIRQAVGTFSGSTTTHGFNKRYKYDERLMYSYPPSYPGTGIFEIVSWQE
ncbi:MAG: hypothetical protein A2V93_03060 [Ignavibacteria bacterium RBG_16_34_14]|nr:MAG: hypothetical protein A2V93_03060 [Ignavibacteria bacterium RBG_16_34_14]